MSQHAIRFTRATPADDPDIRRLLRENPLGGRYGLSLEREPDAFAGPFGHDFVLARDGEQAIGLFERTVLPVLVDGERQSVPYLGALRVAASHRHRIAIIRAGYAALRREFGGAGDTPLALTSITSDNAPAMRLLTAGLRGLPIYRPYAGFSTFALRPRRRALGDGVVRADADDLPEIAAFLLARNRRFQFATAWDEATLRGLSSHGLDAPHFLLARQSGRIVGCVALWNVGGFRQSVIRHYPRGLATLRPIANVAARIAGWPDLPPVGAPIAQVMLSHLAVADDNPRVFAALLDGALGEAARRGFGAAILALASARGLAAQVRARRGHEYRTMLYTVAWPDEAVPAIDTDLLPHPDIALL